MRAAAVTFLFVAALCSVARADKLVVLTDRDALPPALQVALADRHVEVATQAAPEGALQLDRAAAAQHAAMAAEAQAAVWIDGGDVWVASSDGRFLRHAPVPADATPAAFATIAAGLVDQLFAPAIPIAVTVHVDPAPPAAAQLMVDAPPVAAPSERSKHAVLEVGAAASTASYGFAGTLSWPLSDHVQLGMLGEVDHVFAELGGRFLEGTPLYRAGGVLRYNTGGVTRMQLGIAGGIMTGTPEIMGGPDVGGQADTAGFMSIQIAVAHDVGPAYVAVGFEPTFIIDSLSDNAVAMMGFLRVGLPL
ncbi:MAG TPA: hypothetical protein VGG74_07765 [Kofleriaceae bacterium]